MLFLACIHSSWSIIIEIVEEFLIFFKVVSSQIRRMFLKIRLRSGGNNISPGDSKRWSWTENRFGRPEGAIRRGSEVRMLEDNF